MYEYKIFIKDKSFYKKNFEDANIKYYYLFVTTNPKIFVKREIDSCLFEIHRKTFLMKKKSKYLAKTIPINSITNSVNLFNSTHNKILNVRNYSTTNIIGSNISNDIISGKSFFIQKNTEINKIWNNREIYFEKGYMDIMDNFGFFHRWKMASLRCENKRTLISTIDLVTPYKQGEHFNCDINEIILEHYFTDNPITMTT